LGHSQSDIQASDVQTLTAYNAELINFYGVNVKHCLSRKAIENRRDFLGCSDLQVVEVLKAEISRRGVRHGWGW
jgi:hypothetical protein